MIVLLYDLVSFCCAIEGVQFHLRGMVSCRVVIPTAMFLRPHQSKHGSREKHPLKNTGIHLNTPCDGKFTISLSLYKLVD